MDVKVKIMGERNSGTNFLAVTINRSFDTSQFPMIGHMKRWQRFLISRSTLSKNGRQWLIDRFEDQAHAASLPIDGGWKHACITQRFAQEFAKTPGTQVICIIRHPLAWARSMHKNPYQTRVAIPIDFSEFLQNPWPTRPRDELHGEILDSVLLLWQKKVQSYVDYAARHENIHLVRYEDILLHPNMVFEQLSTLFPAKSDHLICPQKNSRPFTGHATGLSDYQQLAQTVWISALSKPDQDQFHQYLSPALLQRFAYS